MLESQQGILGSTNELLISSLLAWHLNIYQLTHPALRKLQTFYKFQKLHVFWFGEGYLHQTIQDSSYKYIKPLTL
ncbi:hypothetical protein FACHB389_33505 [Nostoc calcicola FACHB-389]|nr:hypothetical protein FACHB389_33505 [Nostoc calcicola FACHB-389]